MYRITVSASRLTAYNSDSGSSSETRQTPSRSSQNADHDRCSARNAADRLAYSVDEAARLTGLSRDLLYDEMRRGNLTYVKIGRRRLITRHHLQQFLADASS